MGRFTATDWYRSGRRNGVNKYEGRKGLIASAARMCMERKGVAKTSIADITREVDITRELFYYYYPNKDAVVRAVLDGYVADARRLLAQGVKAKGEAADELLLNVIKALRSWLATDDSTPVTMLDILRESGEWTTIMYAVATEAIEALRGTALVVENGAVDDAADCGSKIGLVGAMNVMLSVDGLTDEDIAAGIAPLFS